MSKLNLKRDNPTHPYHGWYQTTINYLFSLCIALTISFSLVLNSDVTGISTIPVFVGGVVTFFSWIYILINYCVVIELVEKIFKAFITFSVTAILVGFYIACVLAFEVLSLKKQTVRDNVFFFTILVFFAVLVFGSNEDAFIVPQWTLFGFIVITLTCIQHNVIGLFKSFLNPLKTCRIKKMKDRILFNNNVFSKDQSVSCEDLYVTKYQINLQYNVMHNCGFKIDNPNSFRHFEYHKTINCIFFWCIVITLGIGFTVLNNSSPKSFIGHAVFFTFVTAFSLFVLINIKSILVEFYNWLKQIFFVLKRYFSGR